MTELIPVNQLTKQQKSVVESVPRGVKLMQGPAGTGKTSAGVRRMLRLLTKDKVFANEILVMVPQRALGAAYQAAIDDPRHNSVAGGRVTVETIGSLSRSVVDLFFPLAADALPFGDPHRDPTFLTLETAQYHMAHVVGGLIADKAYFDSVAIARNRLYSQIVDNLNKAALVGFPHTEIAERLIGAWGEKDPAQEIIYRQAQECAVFFREYCLRHTLIDFSLQTEMFRYLWGQPAVQDYLMSRFRHLILDNVEEDTPLTHQVMLDWIAESDSALIIQDTDAGYRRFLGASEESSQRLTSLVTTKRDTFIFDEPDSFVTSTPLQAFAAGLGYSLDVPISSDPLAADPRDALQYEQPRFYTEMIGNVVTSIAEQVAEGTAPGEIVVLAPFLSDSLRYELTEQLRKVGVRARSHRPSRALREETAAQALITWAQLAHPTWGLPPSRSDVVSALVASIDGIDLVRAQLAATQLYRQGTLKSFDELGSGVQERITYTYGERIQALHNWFLAYSESPIDEIDVFWSKLFGEVLSVRGFGFHDDDDKATVTANLIDSARKFRQMLYAVDEVGETSTGLEYVRMVRDGVIADQYLRNWQLDEESEAVLLAPAYTFLMMNRPVDYQYWLNVGGAGWWERLYQPLTHPYVLAYGWPTNQVWTDSDEFGSRNETLYRITAGLVRRCRRGIYLGFSELGEQGYEQRGVLLEAIQRMLRRLRALDEGA